MTMRATDSIAMAHARKAMLLACLAGAGCARQRVEFRLEPAVVPRLRSCRWRPARQLGRDATRAAACRYQSRQPGRSAEAWTNAVPRAANLERLGAGQLHGHPEVAERRGVGARTLTTVACPGERQLPGTRTGRPGRRWSGAQLSFVGCALRGRTRSRLHPWTRFVRAGCARVREQLTAVGRIDFTEVSPGFWLRTSRCRVTEVCLQSASAAGCAWIIVVGATSTCGAAVAGAVAAAGHRPPARCRRSASGRRRQGQARAATGSGGAFPSGILRMRGRGPWTKGNRAMRRRGQAKRLLQPAATGTDPPPADVNDLEDRRIAVLVDGDVVPASLIPVRCWIAPLMPTAMYSSGAMILPVWPTCSSFGT